MYVYIYPSIYLSIYLSSNQSIYLCIVFLVAPSQTSDLSRRLNTSILVYFPSLSRSWRQADGSGPDSDATGTTPFGLPVLLKAISLFVSLAASATAAVGSASWLTPSASVETLLVRGDSFCFQNCVCIYFYFIFNFLLV